MIYTQEEIQNKKKKHEKRKKVIAIILYIILIPILIYNTILIAETIVNPNKTPSIFGIKTYVIISESMKPALEIGDIVLVKEQPEEELKVGDLISFRRGELVITHRIQEIIETNNVKQYVTKGDHNNVQDAEYITEEDIEGKVIIKIPYLGKIVLALKNKVVIISIIIIYYVYLLMNQSMKKRKQKRNLKRIEYETRKREDNEKERKDI